MDLQSSCLWNVWGWDLWPLATLVPRDREGTAASQSAVCWWWCFDSLWPEKICCHHRSSHELLTFSVRPEPRRFETQIRHSRWRGRAWRYRTAMQQQKHKGTQRLQKQYNHNTASLVCTYCYRLTPGHAKSWYPQRLATKCSETSYCSHCSQSQGGCCPIFTTVWLRHYVSWSTEFILWSLLTQQTLITISLNGKGFCTFLPRTSRHPNCNMSFLKRAQKNIRGAFITRRSLKLNTK